MLRANPYFELSAMLPLSNKTCLLTIDVEDWYHILDVPSTLDITEWDSRPARVERNFNRLLEILDRKYIKATCFFLGWVAQKFPQLVRSAQAAGHEIASHGFSHRLIYQMSETEFYDDAARAKKVIEDIAGVEVHGYRAPGFSVTEQTPWFFEALMRAGYQYDSSVFPAARGHGGIRTGRIKPYRAIEQSPGLIELPISVTKILGKRLCFFGGGYLRLFPYSVIKHAARKVLAENRPVIFYIHPRDIDPDQPRLPMNPFRAFKTYVNLGGTEKKLQLLLDEFDWLTVSEYIKSDENLSEKK